MLERLVLDRDLDWSDKMPAKFHRPGLYLSQASMYGGKTTAALLDLENHVRPIINAVRGRNEEADVNSIAIGVQPSNNVRDLGSDTIQSRFVTSRLAYERVDPGEPESLLAEPFASYPVWFIEEIEFFSEPIAEVIDLSIEQGRMIFATGLNRDFAGRPFGSMPKLLALAEPSPELYAACETCGDPASRTQRLLKRGGHYVPAPIDAPIISIEGKDEERYEPRCWTHHEVPGRYESLVENLRAGIERRDRARDFETRKSLAGGSSFIASFMEPSE